MTLSKEKIEVSTLKATLALVGVLIGVGLYIGDIKTDIASAEQTNVQQTKDIDEIKNAIKSIPEIKAQNELIIKQQAATLESLRKMPSY